MSTIDGLPPDQRAVLQLVLQRGRSYEEIAAVLSIERDAVRQRALDALAALGPSGGAPAPERALVTDYLLGQLPGRVADEVSVYLAASEADRVWAAAVSVELALLSPDPLPEIPASSRGGDSTGAPAASAPAATVEAPAAPAASAPAATVEGPAAPARVVARPPARRRGAMVLSSLAALVVAAAVVVIVLTSSGSSSPAGHGARPPASTATTPATGTSTETASTPASAAGPKLLATLHLSSPSDAANTLGVAQVVRTSHAVGVVIDAQGLPANSPHNAYAVWLYDSPANSRLVGFVPSLVGSNGRLETEGTLPSDAGRYRRLLVTLETQASPKRPGQVILSGPFRERS